MMLYKRNLWFIGVLLLTLFIIAVWLVGIGIDKTARQMHSSMLKEVGYYRADLIALDFNRTFQLTENIREYMEEHPADREGLQELLKGIMKLDVKVSRIWLHRKEKQTVVIDSTGSLRQDSVLHSILSQTICDEINGGERGLYRHAGILYWSILNRFEQLTIGLDVSLTDLHAYFAERSPNVRSYAYVVNSDGVIVVHPDESRIGCCLTEEMELRHWKAALQAGKVWQGMGFSSYLLVPVEQIYYPVVVGKERWVIVVSVPELIAEEEMVGFHHYTFVIAVFTVLIFSVLLAYSQYRWRKEYDRRRKLEQEALQLDLQQLKNQINPHFLFNSLNSLNALISSDPTLAKEFVLNLSKIYRYVLEKKGESLVPVADEIQFIRHYYFLQQIRFRDQLKLIVESDLSLEERQIPVMSLQMLMENAIKHNEITQEYPLEIRIYANREEVVVENSYRPRLDTTDNSFGVGFENIRKIYDYCSDKQFHYTVENGKFICHLPFI